MHHERPAARPRRAALALWAAVAAATPLAAQTVPAPGSGSAAVRALPAVGSAADDSVRLAQLLSGAPAAGYLLRSPSGALAGGAGSAAPGWELLAPELATVWNSALPFSLNDGSLWAGRGLSTRLTAGAVLRWGPVTAVAAPEVVYQQNREFDTWEGEVPPTGPYVLPWYAQAPSADLPLRPGDEASTRVRPGQSSLTVAAGPVAFGAATENQWWGPGIRNAIVLSNNAPGFPHAFLRTGAPVRTRAGSFEAKWILGRLSESAQFDTAGWNDRRAVSALVATYSPALDPNLTLGAARSVYSLVPEGSSTLGRFADVLARWTRRDDPEADEDGRYNQVLSLFGRWVLPEDGLEVYGEWSRQDLPSTFGEASDHLGYSQGFTLGVQYAREMRSGALRLQGEATTLQQSPSALGTAKSYYTSLSVPQGYTHEGQVLGAAIGPGANSQWLAADYLAGRWSLGLFGGRIRWDDDAFLNSFRAQYVGWPFLAHDVSVFGGLRGGYALPWLRLDAELTSGVRYNFLFQNRGQSWETSDDATDVRNHTLRVVLTPGRPALPQRVGTVPPPPAADSTAAPLVRDPSTRPVPPAARPDPAARTPAPATRTPAPARTHTVRAGETLFAIARRYGVSVDALRAANPAVQGDRIQAGQTLRIPPVR
jgi:hypothetical protein